jgi:hypothetical protein
MSVHDLSVTASVSYLHSFYPVISHLPGMMTVTTMTTMTRTARRTASRVRVWCTHILAPGAFCSLHFNHSLMPLHSYLTSTGACQMTCILLPSRYRGDKEDGHIETTRRWRQGQLERQGERPQGREHQHHSNYLARARPMSIDMPGTSRGG